MSLNNMPLNNKNNLNEPVKCPVSIFGSCVSRDLLEFDRHFFSLKTYVARQSVVSSVSEPAKLRIDDIKLESDFQKNQVYGDMVKNTFERFRNDGSKYLIIDLIDERFKLVDYEGTIVTCSSEFVKADITDNIKTIERVLKNKRNVFTKKNFCKYMIKDIELDYYMNKFCKEVLSVYKGENIIIHRAMMLDYYKDSFGDINKFGLSYIKNNNKINSLLDYMYDYLCKKLTKAKVIDICDGYVADSGHKWGLAPMHYQEEYYIKALKCLKGYVI